MDDQTGYADSTNTTATATPPPAGPTPPISPPSAPEPPEPPHQRSGGVTAGIILILIGVAMLVARTIPGVAVWELWPFFVIVPGLVQCFSPGKDGWSINRFFDGLVTVTIGVILLGNTTGYLSWGVWWQILMLWPVLLISAGLGILGKATGQEWVRVLGTIAVLAAFAYAAVTSYTGMTIQPVMGTPSGQEFTFSEPQGSTDEATLTMKSGVGELTVDDGTGLVRIDGVTPFGDPTFSVDRSGSSADVRFNLTEQDSFMLYPGSPSARVDTELGSDVEWDVNIDSGVSRLDADLSGVPVSRLTLKTGVSDNTVRLGEVPAGVDEARASFQSGVSSVRVFVPADAEVRVESDSGLTGHQISSDFVSKGGGRWETEGYEAARSAGRPVWVISVKSGVGSFILDTY